MRFQFFYLQLECVCVCVYVCAFLGIFWTSLRYDAAHFNKPYCAVVPSSNCFHSTLLVCGETCKHYSEQFFLSFSKTHTYADKLQCLKVAGDKDSGFAKWFALPRLQPKKK